jgi:hypothetical protein
MLILGLRVIENIYYSVYVKGTDSNILLAPRQKHAYIIEVK